MGYLFVVFSPFFSSTENSGVGFLQQGPAKGKRKDNGCLFWGGGGGREGSPYQQEINLGTVCLLVPQIQMQPVKKQKMKDEGRPDQSQM